MTTFTLTDTQLRDLLAPVVPMASTDKTLPILNSVVIEKRGKHLTAYATDRFVLGMTRVRVAVPDVKAVVPLATVKRVLSLFRPRRGVHREVSVWVEEVGAENVWIYFRGNLSDGGKIEVGAPLRTVPDYPPVVENILAGKVNTPVEHHVTALQPHNLSKFTHMAGQPLTIATEDPTKPVVLTQGEDFIGVAMPVRFQYEQPSPTWGETLKGAK